MKAQEIMEIRYLSDIFFQPSPLQKHISGLFLVSWPVPASGSGSGFPVSWPVTDARHLVPVLAFWLAGQGLVTKQCLGIIDVSFGDQPFVTGHMGKMAKSRRK